MMPTEIIKGQIVAKANHYQVSRSRMFKDKAIKAYEKHFDKHCTVYRDKHIDVPFVLHAAVYTRTERLDLDNSLKTLLDCLQYAHAIADDNLCMGIHARKVVDKNSPRVEYSIEPIVHAPQLF